MLFSSSTPASRLHQLAAASSQLGATGLRLIAVGLGPSPKEPPHGAQPPFVVGASSDVIDALALFRALDDGGETELLLDRAGNVQACWAANMPGGLAPPAALIVDAERVARIAKGTPSHAGHGY